MDDEMAFGMLSRLHSDAVERGQRARFAEWISVLRERYPEVYDHDAGSYLEWCMEDALAEDRRDDVPMPARELAQHAGRSIDAFSRAAELLGYCGELSVLVEALRVAWPHEKASDQFFAWVIDEFAQTGVVHEIFDYLEHTTSADPNDPVLNARVRYFMEDLREDVLRELIEDLTGTSGREWKAADFVLPPAKRQRDEWDDDVEERPVRSPAEDNLSRLVTQFTGYLRREEGVPFSRGELVRHELYRYFMKRHDGDLDPRPSMLEQALHPERKLPKPPRPRHPLCPERVTLNVHLAHLMGMMSGRYCTAAALFQAMPAWLRFLESRGLIDAGIRKKVLEDLTPLHAQLQRLWEHDKYYPWLYRDGKAWPDAKG